MKRRLEQSAYPLVIVVLLALAAGLPIVLNQGSRGAPYKTLARPPLAGLKAPDSSCPHVMGGCLPHAPGLRQNAQIGGITGPDLSNNDPVGSRSGWQAIANHSRFAYLKSTEGGGSGGGFFDVTARPMAALAMVFGLPVGGYDFIHLCSGSGHVEAAHFIASAIAQGLIGLGRMPPAADVEYGSGSCGGRSWLSDWVATVVSMTGVCPIFYTGAWFWQPNLGSYWPQCRGHDVISWISGYGVAFPYLPSGLSHLDFWQKSDHGYNGYNYADLSVWMHDEASFRAVANQPPPGVPCFGPGAHVHAKPCVLIRPRVAALSREADRRSAEIVRLRAVLIKYNCRQADGARGAWHDRVVCQRPFRLGTMDHLRIQAIVAFIHRALRALYPT